MIADGAGLGTILNDDIPPIYISVADVAVIEGNGGSTEFVFTVTLTNAGSEPISVKYATADGTASSKGNAKDYDKVSNGTLTFTPGETSQTISILVSGDADSEPNETFFVNLSSATGALLADSQAIGTILDDDTVLALLAAEASPDSASRAAALEVTSIQPLLAEAIRRWTASGVETSGLATVGIRIVDLPETMVGRASGSTIFLDPTAAGHGWFIDVSPWEDSEFEHSGDQGEPDRLDLLTVVMHEVDTCWEWGTPQTRTI